MYTDMCIFHQSLRFHWPDFSRRKIKRA